MTCGALSSATCGDWRAERERERERVAGCISDTGDNQRRTQGHILKMLLKSSRRKPYKIKLYRSTTPTTDKNNVLFVQNGRNELYVIHPWTETGTMVSMGHNQIVLTYIAHTGCLAALKTFTMKPFYTQHSTHQRTGIDQIKSSWKTTQL